MIVLDCSAAVEIARGTSLGSGFRALMLEREKVVTSTLFTVEVRNAFWKYVHAGLLDHNAARGYATKALALVDETIPLEENIDEAFLEAARLDHSVYDLLYLTLARRRAATLFTADRRLVSLCEQTGVDYVREVDL